MNEKEISEILKEHSLWLYSEGGKRADLFGADLRDANLFGADLCGADLRGAKRSQEVKTDATETPQSNSQ